MGEINASLKTGILYGCIGALVGAFLFFIIKNKSSHKLKWVISGAIIFAIIFSFIAGSITKEDYNQYISEKDEEKICGKDVCEI